MNYSLLIYERPADFAARADPARQPAFWQSWKAYSKAPREAGIMAGGAGLEPPETATTARLSGGERLAQDGQYADTKEQLGGFFIIDVPDLDTALAWAARDSHGRLVAWLAASRRDVAAAEDALADAFHTALTTWPASGVPHRPDAWLPTAARRRRHCSRSPRRPGWRQRRRPSSPTNG